MSQVTTRLMNPTVVLLRGLPGAGKTTYRRANYPAATCVDVTDHFPGGRWPADSDWPSIHASVDDAIYDLLDRGAHQLIVVERCFIRRYPVDVACNMAGYHGYGVRVVSFHAALSTLAQRNEARGLPLTPEHLARMAEAYDPDPTWLEDLNHVVHT